MNENILQWQGGRLDFSSGCVVMGILNVTADSFSDGGMFLDADRAVARGVEMAGQGAAIIDIGAESTRPGARPVSADEQIARVIPVIKGLSRQVEAPLSIDTRDPEVARAALDAGASMINDVTALGDEGMVRLAGERQVPVILMHMQGTPETMQEAPQYGDVVSEVLGYLLERAKRAEEAGVRKEMIFIDPGIGFGKTLEHNIELLASMGRFVGSGYRVLVGTSRKRFIGELTGGEKPSDRLFGTAATVAIAAAMGAAVVRVHDVRQMCEVVSVANRIGRKLFESM